MRFRGTIAFLSAVWLAAGCKTIPVAVPSHCSRFVGIEDFSSFARGRDTSGNVVLLSPIIQSPINWEQLILSWNADAPTGTALKVEATAITGGTRTGFYVLGNWSLNARAFPRGSLRGQQDTDGAVKTDTLVLNRPASAAQIRLTLEGTNGMLPNLKFFGLSFSDFRQPAALCLPNTAVWGRSVVTPEESQYGYEEGRGWCSPTCVSMVLAYWARTLDRRELEASVPQVAAAVYDPAYPGTGNWSFNTAFAGSIPGMRSYVSRFDDLSEVEAWIGAGIPVVLSARWDLLEPGRHPDPEGHLIVCIGFTADGDVVVNEPATRLDRGESVRRVYRRQDVRRAWAASGNTVYLIYPAGTKIPANRCGQWNAADARY
jgi:hypothetical protein